MNLNEEDLYILEEDMKQIIPYAEEKEKIDKELDEWEQQRLNQWDE